MAENLLFKLSQVNNDFGLINFGNLSQQNNNDIISPVSILCAMSMLYNGANGETAIQLKQLLGYDKHNISDGDMNETFNVFLTHSTADNDNFVINIANRLLVQNKYPILNRFTDTLKNSFKADIQSVDFEKDGINVVKEINQWIATKTNNKIEKLFDEPFQHLTRLVIVNAVYFKGDWLYQFSPQETHKSIFYNNGNIWRITRVDMMSKMKASWNYTNSVELDSELLELPYKGNDLSFIVVLPRKRDGLQKLKSIINYELFNNAIKQFELTDVDIYLPKFKVEQTYNLQTALNKNMKLNIFTNEADLSGINGKKDLYVSLIVHKVVLEVNEKGSEAAATATAVVADVFCIGYKPPRLIFKADHPFLYLIRDKRNDVILFIGQINRL